MRRSVPGRYPRGFMELAGFCLSLLFISGIYGSFCLGLSSLGIHTWLPTSIYNEL